MRPGLVIGFCHDFRYRVPAHQTPPNLLAAFAEVRELEPVFPTGFMVAVMEVPCMKALLPQVEPGERVVNASRSRDSLAAKQAQLAA